MSLTSDPTPGRAGAVTVVPAAALPRTAAEWMAARIAAAVAARGSCSLALSGGETPRPVYEQLAAAPLAGTIDWALVEIFFGDERAVPPDHPDSNYRMASAALLDRVPIPAAQVHRMAADRPDRDAAAREYERRLPPSFDVLLLGMGGDGHTASLFPGSPALGERHRLVVPADAPFPPVARLTLTPPAITAAREIAVVVSGEGKAAMVARALQGPRSPLQIPVQFAAHAQWFLDEPAASRLADAKEHS